MTYLSGLPHCVQNLMPAPLRVPQMRQVVPETPVRRLLPQNVQNRLIGLFRLWHLAQVIQLLVGIGCCCAAGCLPVASETPQMEQNR